MVEPSNPVLSIGKQCRLLSISRSSFYYAPQGEPEMNLALMQLIDRQFLETPFYGVRQMPWHLQNDGSIRACRERNVDWDDCCIRRLSFRRPGRNPILWPVRT